MQRVSLLTFLLLSVCFAGAQTYKFSQLTTEDGLAQDFVYSINQDKNGYLFIGTGEGLSRFDGITFRNYREDDGLGQNMVTSSFMDLSGDLWYGHNNGAISVYTKGQWKVFHNPELTKSTVVGICQGYEGVVFATQNDGLFCVRNNQIEKLGKFGAGSFYALGGSSKEIVAGTNKGVIALIRTGGSYQVQDTGFENKRITVIQNSSVEGMYYIGSPSGFFARLKLQDGKLLSSTWEDDKINLKEYPISAILEDRGGCFWLGTEGMGIIKLCPDSAAIGGFDQTYYNLENGLPGNYIKSLFEDAEGNIWIGTFGNGLVSLQDDYFTFYSHEPGSVGNQVSAILETPGSKWFGVENGLIRITPGSQEGFVFYSAENGLVDDRVTSMHYDGTLIWIGTANHGIFKLDPVSEKISRIRADYGSLANRINQLTGDENSIWAATQGGLLIVNKETGNTNLFDTEVGMAHNDIHCLLRTDDGKIWMGTHSRFLYCLSDYSIEKYEVRKVGELEVVSITADKNGNLWLATSEAGVYRFSDGKFRNFSVRNGLHSNYTYAIHQDGNGQIWVGHRGALSRINPDNLEIKVYSHEEGVKDQVMRNAMYVDHQNMLWIGTEGGAIMYDQSKEQLSASPPAINLIELRIGDDVYSGENEIFLPYGVYRVQFEFIGISFRDPEEVTYQYMLEGHDEQFSDQNGSNIATYGRIDDGDFTFKVRACNGDGVCAEHESLVRIHIAKPYWKKIWFYFFMTLLISAIIIMGVRLRLQRLKKIQEYLKEQLDIKTHEVVEKAKTIEAINKDLTDSINYAERIQHSILPDVDLLTSEFPDSFVFMKPRDVVSGDFYFIRKINQKLIVACVDCTGHGVPGAFMSMIGSVSLRKIYDFIEETGRWMTPDQVIEQLDQEIKTVLQQKPFEELEADDAFYQSRDGMDLALCEIDLETNTLILSSAMRHSIVCRQNETRVIPGTKRSVGGGFKKSIPFEAEKMSFKKGDALYLFSDGFSDQFGQETGKKLKVSGTTKFIESLQNYKIQAYDDQFSEFFDNWKGDRGQLDDVLVIGIIF